MFGHPPDSVSHVIRRLRGSCSCDYDRTGIRDASLVAKTELRVPQQRTDRDRAVPPVLEPERER